MKKNIVFLIYFTISLLTLSCGSDNQLVKPPGLNPEQPEDKPDDLDKPLVVDFKESFEAFSNPERGFYTYTKFESNKDENSPLTVDLIKKFRKEGITLIFTTHLLKDFIDKPISTDFLQLIRTNLQALREGGAKSIMRFCYSDQIDAKEFDAPWSIMENHIQQLAPIFTEFVDVISVLEAGFIGAWGEWYYTTHYIFQPEDNQYAPRKKVLDALLKAMPKERMISVRYPKAKLKIFDLKHNDSITLDQAYNGSDLSRVSAHNDCVFADQDDRGTFGNNRNYRTYWTSESKYYAMGGESCFLSSYADCQNAIPTLKEYHWSYLNINYHLDVLEHWRKNGCFGEIERNLGYRFVLDKGEFTKQVEREGILAVRLSLINRGYAAPYNPRDVELIISLESDPKIKHSFKLDYDPRFWFSDVTININEKVKLPSKFKAGKYNLYLNLPDPKETLANKAEFSIRCANDGIWEAETGYNKLTSFDILD